MKPEEAARNGVWNAALTISGSLFGVDLISSIAEKSPAILPLFNALDGFNGVCAEAAFSPAATLAAVLALTLVAMILRSSLACSMVSGSDLGSLLFDGKRLPFVEEVLGRDSIVCAVGGGFGEEGGVAGDVGAKGSERRTVSSVATLLRDLAGEWRVLMVMVLEVVALRLS